MFKHKKCSNFFASALLVSLLLMAALNFNMINVKAQGQATVNVFDTIGGTTNPGPGTYTYGATAVTFTATPNQEGFLFLYWIVSVGGEASMVTDNPALITFSGGLIYSVAAIFEPVQIVPGVPYNPRAPTTDAYVGVLDAVGGTTNPPPGVYRLANASQFYLTAIPSSGWQFSHWVISGFPYDVQHGGDPFTGIRTENPYLVDHGYGNRYNYQPIFVLEGTTESTPTPTASPTGIMGGLTTETAIIIGLVAVIIILLIAFGVYAMRRSKK